MRFLVTLAVVGSTLVGAGSSRLAERQLPQHFTNLQVLPKDIASGDLIGLMRSFALGLGTRCEHCHVGAGNDLQAFDFASDSKPEKTVARKMMRLVTAVNRDFLKGVGEPDHPVTVTCYTCHRGALKPLTAPPSGPGRP